VVIDGGEALGSAAAAQLSRLGARVCRIDAGLTDTEFARIEGEFGAPQQVRNDTAQSPRATVEFWRDFL
jgi:choline dehydrogenase-like flavoprotein